MPVGVHFADESVGAKGTNDVEGRDESGGRWSEAVVGVKEDR